MEEKIDKGLNWFDKALSIVDKYRFKTIFKAVAFILIVAATVGFIKNPTWIFEKYEEWKRKEHEYAMEQRFQNSEKIHVLSERLLHAIDADRVLVLELHNGLENANGLPFSKCSATYEALDLNVKPVSDQYQNVNLSLMPFVMTLFESGYWCGDVEEIKDIDKGLYYKLKSNGTEHFAACIIEGVNEPLAILFASFDKTLDEMGHDCNHVRENIRHVILEHALLLELNKTNQPK
jgi:hypothetical protein